MACARVTATSGRGAGSNGVGGGSSCALGCGTVPISPRALQYLDESCVRAGRICASVSQGSAGIGSRRRSAHCRRDREFSLPCLSFEDVAAPGRWRDVLDLWSAYCSWARRRIPTHRCHLPPFPRSFLCFDSYPGGHCDGLSQCGSRSISRLLLASQPRWPVSAWQWCRYARVDGRRH